MSARSAASRQSIPTPYPGKVTTPPSSRPILAASKAYASEPPVIRERLRTVDLEEDDDEETRLRPASELVRKAPVSVEAIPPPAALPTISDVRAESSDALFDALYEVNFASSTWEAAAICAKALARALDARAVVVHAHDPHRGEILAVGAYGDGDLHVVGTSASSADDIVASAVLQMHGKVTMTLDGPFWSSAPQRWHAMGEPERLVAVPAFGRGHCVAIVEVLDPSERYAARIAHAATYVAERFAEFLVESAS